MNAQRLTGLGLLFFGLGIAANALIGPLVLGWMKLRVNESFTNQYLGGEVMSLFIVAPMALVAGGLWLRGHRLAAPLAIGPAIYTLYLLLTVLLGADYAHQPGNQELFFFLHWPLLLLSWVLIVRAWAALDRLALPVLSARLRWTVAGALLVIGALFGLMWLRQVTLVMTGEPVPDYPEGATLFWLIRTFDLAFFVPLAFYTAVGLIRRARGALKLAYALVGFFTCEIGAVAGMLAVQLRTGNPAASVGLFVILLTLATFMAILTGALLRALPADANSSGRLGPDHATTAHALNSGRQA